MATPATESIPGEEWQTAIARSAVYLFLSHALAYPANEHQALLRAHLAPVLAEMDSGPRSTAALAESLAAMQDDLEMLQAAHVAIFSLTVSADCPDFETAYLPNDIFRQADVMADAAGFYRAQGLEVGGQQFQRPDYLTTEIEFMGFLARKEAYALEHATPADVASVRGVQALFLRDHLGCWGPAMGRRIEAQAAKHGPALEPVGRLLAEWLGEEMERFAVEPAWTAGEPLIEWPEPDDGACGTTTDSPLVDELMRAPRRRGDET